MSEELRRCPLCSEKAASYKFGTVRVGCSNDDCGLNGVKLDAKTWEKLSALAADARLGRMVRTMPVGAALIHDEDDVWQVEMYPTTLSDEETPEEALEKAGVKA